MTTPRDPRRKKQLELERDHRVLPRQGNKTFRKAWRQKKAKKNRAVRRAETVATAHPTDDAEILEDQVMAAASGHARRLQKEGVVSLEEQLALRHDKVLRWSGLMALNKAARGPAARRFKAKPDNQ
jgi:hypothetical protein